MSSSRWVQQINRDEKIHLFLPPAVQPSTSFSFLLLFFDSFFYASLLIRLNFILWRNQEKSQCLKSLSQPTAELPIHFKGEQWRQGLFPWVAKARQNTENHMDVKWKRDLSEMPMKELINESPSQLCTQRKELWKESLKKLWRICFSWLWHQLHVFQYRIQLPFDLFNVTQFPFGLTLVFRDPLK